MPRTCNEAIAALVSGPAVGPRCLLGSMEVPADGVVLACVPGMSDEFCCQSCEP